MDLAGVARVGGLTTFSISFEMMDKSIQGRVELFAISNQIVRESWLQKINIEPENFTLQYLGYLIMYLDKNLLG